MAGDLRLLRTERRADEGLVELLRELLTLAESGRLRAMVCVLDDADGVEYAQAGDFNEFELAGHMPALAWWLIEGEDE